MALTDKLTAIANAIRGKTGSTDPMTLDEMPSAIDGIPDLLEVRITNNLTEYVNHRITKIHDTAFGNCTALVKLHLPNMTGGASYCFQNCRSLVDYDFSSVRSFGAYAFTGCKGLTKMYLPSLTYLHNRIFSGCTSLDTIIMPITSRIVGIDNIYVFENTPIASGTGYIYVPRALVDGYKTATNWSNFANQIRAIEDYPEICGG